MVLWEGGGQKMTGCGARAKRRRKNLNSILTRPTWTLKYVEISLFVLFLKI